MRKSFVGLVAAGVAFSCGESPTAPFAELQVAVDQSSYAAGEPIALRLVNAGTSDAFFYHCNHRLSFVVEKRTEGGWSDWGRKDGPPCQAVYPSGIEVLLPASTYERVLDLDEPGTYRVRFEPGTSSESIGSHVVRSGSFSVR